jgi:hypothetical protein
MTFTCPSAAMQPTEVIEPSIPELIIDIEANKVKMREWETLFFDKIVRLVRVGRSLKPPELQTLKTLHRKVTKA